MAKAITRGDLVTIVIVLLALMVIFRWWDNTSSHPEFLPQVDIQTTTDKVPLYSLLPSGKPTLVSFWSVSCGPCLKEIPDLKNLQRNHSDKISIVAINMRHDPPNSAMEMAKGLPYQVALDLDGTLAGKLGVHFTPTYFMVGSDGKIHYKKVGRINFAKLVKKL